MVEKYKPDVLESVENRRHTIGMQLFDLLSEDFSSGQFTLGDVRSFNDYVKNVHYEHQPGRTEFGQAHVDYLIERGLVEEESSGMYGLTPEAYALIERRS